MCWEAVPETIDPNRKVGMLEYSFPRLFVPWNIRSHDGTFVLGTIRSLELSFSRLFVLWNIHSLDRSFPGTFVPETNKHCRHFPPRTTRSLDRSFPETFVPGTLDLSCRGPFVHLSELLGKL